MKVTVQDRSDCNSGQPVKNREHTLVLVNR